MYMAVALLVWVAWIIKMKYEVRRRRYENTCEAYLKIVSRPRFAGAGFFLSAGTLLPPPDEKSQIASCLHYNQIYCVP